MHRLHPHEPGRSRSEFARLLREARTVLQRAASPDATPRAGAVSAAMAKATAADDPSTLLGTPYKLIKRIGEGASGQVWEAEHVELGRVVALKILAPVHGATPAALERFRHEARAVAQLSHPNLVGILDFGRSLDGRAYLAMERLVGETLDAAIRRGPLPWRDAVRIGCETAQALVAAHAAGLVHRDIKPENLFLTKRGEVRVLDFGLATALTQAADRKPAGRELAMRGFAIFGTPEYMAPEQVACDPVDGRTDVYALGCVVYEMLTGTRAFEGPSCVAVMGKQLRETPMAPRVRAAGRDIPPSLDRAVMRAMKKMPDERFASAEEFLKALRETAAAPERRNASLRRVAHAAGVGLAVIVAAVGSAQWARSHADALDVPLPPAPASATGAAISSAAPVSTAVAAMAVVPAAAASFVGSQAPPGPSSTPPHETHAGVHGHTATKGASGAHAEHAAAHEDRAQGPHDATHDSAHARDATSTTSAPR